MNGKQIALFKHGLKYTAALLKALYDDRFLPIPIHKIAVESIHQLELNTIIQTDKRAFRIDGTIDKRKFKRYCSNQNSHLIKGVK